MLRLHEENLNTPKWFDGIWSQAHRPHRYDSVRLREFLLHVKPGFRVLDVGAGWWGFAQYALDKMPRLPAKYYALDFSLVAIRRTHTITPSLPYVCGAALDLPFGDETFEIVGSGELIEHMEVPQDLVKEMARVTKPGGWMTISTVNPQCPAAKAHGDYPEHLWEFSPGELVSFFDPHGLTVYREVGDYHTIQCQKKKR